MTTPDVAELARGLTEWERSYVLATPLQQPSDAGIIAYRSGVGNGWGFAGFARRNLALFQRMKNVAGTAWQYRLSEAGYALRAYLSQPPKTIGEER